MMAGRASGILLAGAVLLGLASVTAADDLFSKPRFVSSEPVAPVRVSPRGAAKVDLRFRLAPGMHINSHRPSSELLIPTVLRLMPPQDLVISKLLYPRGEVLALPFAPDAKLSVYSGQFTVTALLQAAPGLKPGSYAVAGQLRYQACSDKVCYPPMHLPIEFRVDVAPAAK